MNFEKTGSGDPVILVHGLGASLFSWRSTVEILSKRFTTYAVDLIGFGKSAAPAGFTYTAEAQASAVAEFIKKEGLVKPIVIGHSMGGAVCLYLATQAGKNGFPALGKMVLIAPVESPPTGSMVPPKVAAILMTAHVPGFNAAKNSTDLAAGLLEAAYAPGSTVSKEQIDGYAAGLAKTSQVQAIGKHALNMMQISFSKAGLQQISNKTMIIWGDADPVLNKQRGSKLAENIPGAELFLVQQCGHIPQEEQPAKTNAAIDKFLQ